MVSRATFVFGSTVICLGMDSTNLINVFEVLWTIHVERKATNPVAWTIVCLVNEHCAPHGSRDVPLDSSPETLGPNSVECSYSHYMTISDWCAGLVRSTYYREKGLCIWTDVPHLFHVGECYPNASVVRANANGKYHTSSQIFHLPQLIWHGTCPLPHEVDTKFSQVCLHETVWSNFTSVPDCPITAFPEILPQSPISTRNSKNSCYISLIEK